MLDFPIISNGNRTEWSPIRSVIIRVITKSDDRAAGVRFVYHEYDWPGKRLWERGCPKIGALGRMECTHSPNVRENDNIMIEVSAVVDVRQEGRDSFESPLPEGHDALS